ncbi:TonB family protein [Spirosoma linguale]|uniref:TonB family protein n=1 Tax=Spirosoma linguale (strain ATCC 33905 / DSM 74 / LMG 10896 / Claus 1) TaxID=504472 RepID=D2QMI5_SPILD|nr:TonB family protein [Spirosoma linguale DSM 74]
MRLSFLPLLLSISYTSFAQQPVFKAFETDTAAEPHGGMSFLTTFIQTNLRKPIAAEAKGVGGRSTLSGIVETDGRISEVKLLNSFRPDCDREALRVFKLFNAWKPAYKDGKPVRQEVIMPVLFKPNAPFVYINGAKVDYFERNNKPVLQDTSQAFYKRVTPVDTNGVSIGDIIVYEMKDKGWAEYFRLPFTTRKYYNYDMPARPLHSVGNQNYKQDWEGVVYVLDDTGKITRQSYYENGKRIGSELKYHLNGLVAEVDTKQDNKSTITTWYPNGQINQMKVVNGVQAFAQTDPEQVMSLWDSTGRQIVKDGKGQAIYQKLEKSYSDSTRHTLFIEQGAYENGYKQGIWTGRYADGSYFYEERLDKGICQGGKARTSGGDTLRYTIREQQPEFPGGMSGLGQFLSSNLRYPPKAQKANVEGQVAVSFVVCTDGTLCDYEILKSVNPDLDREAVRVVKKMNGLWKPGYQRGEKVRVKYNLPINFTLN